MLAKRRDFLLGAPFGALGLGLGNSLLASEEPAPSESDPGVVNFWVKNMGVPPGMIPGGKQVASGQGSRDINATNAGYGREPILYYLDEEEHTLIPAKELDRKKLRMSGDTKIDWTLQKLRLSSDDHKQFDRFSSGGLYLDFQQHESNTDAISALASSAFGAFFPDGTFRNPFTKSQAIATAGLAGGVQLYTPGHAQSISLPAGIGKTAFSCFAKDRKRSAFGMFVTSILQATSSSLTSLVPLLSMPIIAAPALQAIRALAGSLQAHGAGQHWILQSGPLDVAATSDGSKALSGAIRVTNGTYIAIPKEHGAQLKRLTGWKSIDGFLVPKEADEREVFEHSTSIMPGLSYLSITAKVSPARLGNCLLPLPS